MAESDYHQLIRRVRDAAVLGSCAGLLGWDERTYMPRQGAGHRSEQMALLARLGHEMITAPAAGDLLATAEVETNSLLQDSDQKANLREIRRAYDRAVKLPKSLVEELARVTSQAQGVCQEARRDNDYPKFRPFLDRIIDLKRQEAQAVGFRDSIYDALFDEFEPGATAAETALLFDRLKSELSPMVAAIADSGKRPRRDILEREFPVARQEMFAQAAAVAVGFDFDSGRLDATVHPFCTGLGPGDCRILTRYHLRKFQESFFGVLHEAGHGMYEQGLPASHYGTPVGAAASFGIHESQSRLWENQVGRSLPFWRHFFPRARQTFIEALGDVTLDEFVFAVNDVQPSYIRVDADEATYNLHIILRFELEQDLLTGNLKAADLPGAWSERFQTLFGLTPPDDANGCLQDIHWSFGGFGYFPTYTLGNLYAAQFMAQARRDLPSLDDDLARGEFVTLKHWLNRNIHVQGQRYRPGELCQRVTGRPLDPRPFLDYLRGKFGPLYGTSFN